MTGTNQEADFKVENYEEFYSHHKFVPISDKDFFNVHEIIPRMGWAFDKVEELKPRNLLDLGCLDGSFALTISKHFGIPVTGVDLTEDGILIAQGRSKEHNIPGFFFQSTVEDYLEMYATLLERSEADHPDRGPDPRRYDMITWFELIEHVKDPQKVIALIDRVKSPNATILTSTPAFESPIYGKDDEKNKCHIRLYTTKEEDYEEENKYGNVRKATSIVKEIGKERIREIGVYSELINVAYQ